jgi:pimeloyl-ACP methyl ester carboxylesterase
VLLHEGLGSIGLWKQFPHALAHATGLRVFAYSRYGNGFSDVLQEARTPAYMHTEAQDALPQVLDAAAARSAVLIGQSDGASIALIYAAQNDPRVRGVVALAPHLFVEERSLRGIEAAKHAYETTDLRTRLARYHRDADSTFYGWNDVWLDPAFRSWSIRDCIGKIRSPVLAIQGADDAYGTIAQLDAMREEAKASRVDTLYLGNCGHAPQFERADIVLHTIAAFVGDLQH